MSFVGSIEIPSNPTKQEVMYLLGHSLQESLRMHPSSKCEMKQPCPELDRQQIDLMKPILDMNRKPDEMFWHFVRGLYETNFDENTVKLILEDEEILLRIAKKIAIPFEISDTYEVVYDSLNAIDLLGKLYDHSEMSLFHQKALDHYHKLLSFRNTTSLPHCQIFRTTPDAVLPFKAKPTDAGYDLSVISLVEEYDDGKLLMFETGLVLKPDLNIYAEVYARSSLAKSGYMMANNVGIIDQTYRGTLKVMLRKLTPNAPPITFPFKACQIIFREQVNVQLVESKTNFVSTSRGEGGFGSTGGGIEVASKKRKNE